MDKNLKRRSSINPYKRCENCLYYKRPSGEYRCKWCDKFKEYPSPLSERFGCDSFIDVCERIDI